MKRPDLSQTEPEFIARCAATLASGEMPAGSPPGFEAFLRRRIREYEEKTGEPVRVLVDGEWRRP